MSGDQLHVKLTRLEFIAIEMIGARSSYHVICIPVRPRMVGLVASPLTRSTSHTADSRLKPGNVLELEGCDEQPQFIQIDPAPSSAVVVGDYVISPRAICSFSYLLRKFLLTFKTFL
jgi:hypothetical protein